MATTRLIPLHTGKGRNFGKAIRNVIGYVSNPKKTHQGELVTGFGCNPETADGEFLLMKREYIAQTGRLICANPLCRAKLRRKKPIELAASWQADSRTGNMPML